MYVHLLRQGAKVLEVVGTFGPHVIVLDLVMPDASGLELAEQIRGRYGEDGPVLVAITAYSSDSDRRLAKVAGFHDFVAKPYDPQALLRRIASLRPKT